MDFNPLVQNIYKRHLWVLLLRMPFQFWLEELLMKIANHIGNFIVVDKAALWSEDRRMAQVMVELDILEGLLESFLINWGDISFEQRLDYRVSHFNV